MPEITRDTKLTPQLYTGLRDALCIGRFLGAARRSPVMANGQLPGITRKYSTKYAETLEFIVRRYGSAS